MTSRGRKILYGILIAIGCFLAIAAAVIITFVTWVSRPGELIEPERLLGAESTGYAEWTLRLEDPGTDGFLRLLGQAGRDMRSSDLPPFVDGWLQRGEDDAGLGRDLLPALLAWTLHPAPGADGPHLHLLSLSGERLGNQLVLADTIARFALRRSDDARVYDYKGETIYEMNLPRRDLPATFFARRGAIFATSDVDTARQAVDMLDGETAPGDRPPTALERLFATTRSTDPLRAAVTNERDELAHVWERLGGRADDAGLFAGAAGASLTGGLQADGSFRGVLSLVARDPGPPGAQAAAIAALLTRRLEAFDLHPSVEITPDDTSVRFDVHVPNLVEVLAARMNDRRDQR